ncbi:MAG: glycerol-3-phosphate acyltransferase [Firmicutes bacterium]|nr:glycerol-3-phosphate acyltransferase [Bacillota bacterium]
MSLFWLTPLCIGAYFIGNINFSIIISRFRKKDIRKEGSGNAGATNMLRAFGAKVGLMIFFLDMAKSAIPALVGLLLWGGDYGQIAMYAMGLSAVLGHCYPVIYGFRGGKGVASTAGVFIVANPLVSLAAMAVYIVYFIVWEYGAITSILFVSTLVIFESVRSTHIAASLLIFAFYVLLWITHRKNMVRLLSGAESKASLLKKLKKKKMAMRQECWLAECCTEVRNEQ